MSLATLLLPPALLAVAALAGWFLRPLGPIAGRPLAAGAAWLALAVLVAGWFAGGGTPLELTAPFSLAGLALVIRLDAATALGWAALLTPAALLLTFQRRTGHQAAIGALATSAALSTLAAGSLALAAFGLAATASLVLVLLRHEETGPTLSCWLSLTAAWLALALAAVVVQGGGGTSVYSALPLNALRVPVLALVALATLLCSGLLPWRTWVPDVWTRRRLEAGTLAVALLVPVGFLPLVRTYALAAGQLPSAQLAVGLAAIGVAAAAGAAIRAQAASSRRGLLAEAVPLGAGMALLAIGLGTPLSMVAGLACLAGAGLAAGLAPLAADGRGPAVAVATSVLTGVPPALVFGGWLLAIQASVEGGAETGLLGVAAAGTWVIALAAGARSARLPPAPPDADAAPSPTGAVAGIAVALAGGVALTALLALLVIPAVAEAMPPAGPLPRPAGTGGDVHGRGLLTVNTASAGWAAVLLGGPLVVLGIGGAALARALRRRRGVIEAIRSGVASLAPLPVAPEPLFPPPLAGVPQLLAMRMRELRLPEQYRTVFRLAMLERAMTTGRPWFWVLATVVLAVAVTR